MSPFWVVFGKAYHLPSRLNKRHITEALQFPLENRGEQRLLRLNELDELWLGAYDNAKLYNETIKQWQDKNNLARIFEQGQ